MIGWFVSVLLIAVMSVGSWIPGSVDDALTRGLQAQVGPRAVAAVHVEGDPLLQLPFGHIPSLEAQLQGYRLADLPVRMTLRMTDLHVRPGEAIFQHKAVLTAPAGVWLAVTAATADLQAVADRKLAATPLALRGIGTLREATLGFADGRVVVSGQLERSAGIRVPFQFSGAIALEGGRRLLLTDPRLSLNGANIPAFLLNMGLAGLNPLFDLDKQALPPGDWQLLGVDLEPTGMTLKIGGNITMLPGN